MIDLSTRARSLDHWIKLVAEFQADLAWWEAFLPFPVFMQCMPHPRVQPAVATVTSHTLNFLHSSICWWLESGMTLYVLRTLGDESL